MTNIQFHLCEHHNVIKYFQSKTFHKFMSYNHNKNFKMSQKIILTAKFEPSSKGIRNW